MIQEKIARLEHFLKKNNLIDSYIQLKLIKEGTDKVTIHNELFSYIEDYTIQSEDDLIRTFASHARDYTSAELYRIMELLGPTLYKWKAIEEAAKAGKAEMGIKQSPSSFGAEALRHFGGKPKQEETERLRRQIEEATKIIEDVNAEWEIHDGTINNKDIKELIEDAEAGGEMSYFVGIGMKWLIKNKALEEIKSAGGQDELKKLLEAEMKASPLEEGDQEKLQDMYNNLGLLEQQDLGHGFVSADYHSQWYYDPNLISMLGGERAEIMGTEWFRMSDQSPKSAFFMDIKENTERASVSAMLGTWARDGIEGYSEPYLGMGSSGQFRTVRQIPVPEATYDVTQYAFPMIHNVGPEEGIYTGVTGGMTGYEWSVDPRFDKDAREEASAKYGGYWWGDNASDPGRGFGLINPNTQTILQEDQEYDGQTIENSTSAYDEYGVKIDDKEFLKSRQFADSDAAEFPRHMQQRDWIDEGWYHYVLGLRIDQANRHRAQSEYDKGDRPYQQPTTPILVMPGTQDRVPSKDWGRTPPTQTEWSLDNEASDGEIISTAQADTGLVDYYEDDEVSIWQSTPSTDRRSWYGKSISNYMRNVEATYYRSFGRYEAEDSTRSHYLGARSRIWNPIQPGGWGADDDYDFSSEAVAIGEREQTLFEIGWYENEDTTHYSIKSPYERGNLERAEVAIYPKDISIGGRTYPYDIGRHYNSNLPAGMNELLRATYHPELAPFYMLAKKPSSPNKDLEVSGWYRPKDNGLGFETYDRSVPKVLRGIWYVGLSKNHPNLGDNKDLRDNPGNDHVIGWVHPRTAMVTYYVVNKEYYFDLLDNYQEMKATMESTIATWMRISLKNVIKYNDPRMIAAYRCLEENLKDYSVEGESRSSLIDEYDSKDKKVYDPSRDCFTNHEFYQYGNSANYSTIGRGEQMEHPDSAINAMFSPDPNKPVEESDATEVDEHGQPAPPKFDGPHILSMYQSLAPEQRSSHIIDTYWATRLYTNVGYINRMQVEQRTSYLPFAFNSNNITPDWVLRDRDREEAMGYVHLGLTVLGLIPVYGAIFDFANAILYFIEGEILLGLLHVVFGLMVGYGDLLAVGFLMGRRQAYKAGLWLLDNMHILSEAVKNCVRYGGVPSGKAAKAMSEAEKLAAAAKAARAAGTGEAGMKTPRTIAEMTTDAHLKITGKVTRKEAIELATKRTWGGIGAAAKTGAKHQAKATKIVDNLIGSAEKLKSRVVFTGAGKKMIDRKTRQVVNNIVENEVERGLIGRWLTSGAITDGVSARILKEGMDLAVIAKGGKGLESYIVASTMRVPGKAGVGGLSAATRWEVFRQGVGWGRYFFMVINMASFHFSAWMAVNAYMETLELYKAMAEQNAYRSFDLIGESVESLMQNPEKIVTKYNEYMASCPTTGDGSIDSNIHMQLRTSADQYIRWLPWVVEHTVGLVLNPISPYYGGHTLPFDTPVTKPKYLDEEFGVELMEDDDGGTFIVRDTEGRFPSMTADEWLKYDFDYDPKTIDANDPRFFMHENLTEDDIEYLTKAQKWVREELMIQRDERAFDLEVSSAVDAEKKERYLKWESSLYHYLNDTPETDEQDRIQKNITEKLKGPDGALDQVAIEFLNTVAADLAISLDLAEELHDKCQPEKVLHLIIAAKFISWLEIENSRMYWGHQNQFIDALSALNLAIPWYRPLMMGTAITFELTGTGNVVLAQFMDESSSVINYDGLFSKAGIDAEKIVQFIERYDTVVDSMYLPELKGTRSRDFSGE